jgi:hypothetical protein
MPSEDAPITKPALQVDFSSTPVNHTYKASIEREEYASDRRVRQFKDIVLFTFAMILCGLIAWLAFRTVLTPQAGPDAQKWAMSILFSFASGLVGYLIKR